MLPILIAQSLPPLHPSPASKKHRTRTDRASHLKTTHSNVLELPIDTTSESRRGTPGKTGKRSVETSCQHQVSDADYPISALMGEGMPSKCNWFLSTGSTHIRDAFPRIACSLSAAFLLILMVEGCFAQANTTNSSSVYEASRLNNAALQLRSEGRSGEGIPPAKQALMIFQAKLGPTHTDTANAHNTLGLLYRSLGRFDEALPHYKKALTIRETEFGPTHVDTGISLNNLGVLYKRMGEYALARTLLKRALAITEQNSGADHKDTATSLNNFGSLLTSMGKHHQARRYYERALTIREKLTGHERRATATTLGNLGILLHELGDIKGAQRHYERALAINETILPTGHPQLGLNWHNLAAIAKEQGDFASARNYYKNALSIYEAAYDASHPSIAQTLNNLAVLFHELGSSKDAKVGYERALAIYQRTLGDNHPATAQSHNGLGMVHLARGEFEQAMTHLKRGLEIRRHRLGDVHPLTIHSLSNLSQLNWAKGERATALGLAEQALNAEEVQLGNIISIGSNAQKESFLETYTGSNYAAVGLNLQLGPEDPQATSLALNTILRRKGRALDAQADILGSIRSRLAPVQAEQLAALIELREQRAYLLTRPPRDLSRERLALRTRELSEQIATLESKLSAANRMLRTELDTVVDWKAVQAHLTDKSALVEIFLFHPFNPRASKRNGWGEPRYAAYVLPASGLPWVVSLGDAKHIDDAAKALGLELATRGQKVRDRARELHSLTLAKLEARLVGVNSLVISPDGALQLIPFGALVREDESYLLERFGLSYVTSGRDLLRLATRAEPRSDSLLLGGVAFEGSFGEAVTRGPAKRSAELADLNYSPLPGTKREVEQIGNLLKLPAHRILTGEKATEAAIKNARGPQVLHLATHGFFLPDEGLPDPLLRSGLALSGFNRRHESKGADDGVLTALELSGLDLWGTEITVLSACETGLGEIRNGQGVFGLRRALVLAGARTQITTLWKIADTPTQEIMVSWYSQIKNGIGRANAMRQVQLAALSAAPLPDTNTRLRGVFVPNTERELPNGRLAGTAHPYYWAGFLVYGDRGPLLAESQEEQRQRAHRKR